MMIEISNKKQHKMQSFEWAGRQEHPVEIRSCFSLSKQWAHVVCGRGCFPSLHLGTVTDPFLRGEEVNARAKRQRTPKLLSYLGAADRKSEVH